MQIESKEIIAICSAGAAAIGYGFRHFFPMIFKKEFWKYNNEAYSGRRLISSDPSDNFDCISLSQHELLCAPVKKQLAEGITQFKNIQDSVLWLRALAIVQATPDAIKKADEITGNGR